MRASVAWDAAVYEARPDSAVSYEKKLVLARVGEAKSVLEVGANSGFFSALLRGQGCRVTAVELDRRAAEKAKGRADRVIHGDIEDLRVWDEIGGPFDVILFMHVLEHLADPWRVLRDAVGLLNPGGSIVLLLPNVACWRVRKRLFFRGAFEYAETGILDRTHLRFFTLDSARDLVRGAGLEIVFWTPAEICVPLERRMSRIPVVRGWASWWRRWMSGRFPNLTSEILLFQCRPSGFESKAG